MQTVLQDDARCAEALFRATGVMLAPPFVGLVVTEGETLVGSLAFNNFDHTNVDVSIAIFRPFSVKAMREIACYTFGRLKVDRVTCVTRADNVAAANRLRRLGFVREGRMRHRFPGGADGLIFGLLACEQRLVHLK